MSIKSIALVIIGRNEAKNLEISLATVQGIFRKIIYVDSGSVDSSREIAKKNHAEVIELTNELPFTAARARNAGFNALKNDPEIQYVQFIDGDCELIPGYLDKAIDWLETHLEFGMVCGRRRERYPERSIFNKLCDIEWNSPLGESKYCGGDITIRLDALKQINGYNQDLIAGEDPEICIRLRQAGWRIYRLDTDMTLHDANIMRVSQWWNRQQRTGHAFAEGSHLHGAPPERHWVRESRSNWFWGGLFFVTLISGVLMTAKIWLLLIIFPIQAVRIAINAPTNADGEPFSIKLYYGLDCYLAKIPQFIGQLKFLVGTLTHRKQSLIEYK